MQTVGLMGEMGFGSQHLKSSEVTKKEKMRRLKVKNPIKQLSFTDIQWVRNTEIPQQIGPLTLKRPEVCLWKWTLEVTASEFL